MNNLFNKMRRSYRSTGGGRFTNNNEEKQPAQSNYTQFVDRFREPGYFRTLPYIPEEQDFYGMGMGGEGFVDNLRKGFNYLRNVGSRAVDMYTGPVGTQLRNLIPGTHPYSTQAYPGEKHQLLFHSGQVGYDPNIPRNLVSTANYSGPGTELLLRTQRGDFPITFTDGVANIHDIQYALAETPEDIRKADNRMLNKLEQGRREQLDDIRNIVQAEAGIRGKTLGEDIGFLEKGSFGNLDKKKELTEEERRLLTNKLKELEQQGYGMKPNDKETLKVLEKMTEEYKEQEGGRQGVVWDSNMNAYVPRDTSEMSFVDRIKQRGRDVASWIGSNIFRRMFGGGRKNKTQVKKKDFNKMLFNRYMKSKVFKEQLGGNLENDEIDIAPIYNHLSSLLSPLINKDISPIIKKLHDKDKDMGKVIRKISIYIINPEKRQKENIKNVEQAFAETIHNFLENDTSRNKKLVDEIKELI